MDAAAEREVRRRSDPLDVEPIGLVVHRGIAVRGRGVHAHEMIRRDRDTEQLDRLAGLAGGAHDRR